MLGRYLLNNIGRNMRIIIILMAPQRNVLKILLAAGYPSYILIPVGKKE